MELNGHSAEIGRACRARVPPQKRRSVLREDRTSVCVPPPAASSSPALPSPPPRCSYPAARRNTPLSRRWIHSSRRQRVRCQRAIPSARWKSRIALREARAGPGAAGHRHGAARRLRSERANSYRCAAAPPASAHANAPGIELAATWCGVPMVVTRVARALNRATPGLESAARVLEAHGDRANATPRAALIGARFHLLVGESRRPPRCWLRSMECKPPCRHCSWRERSSTPAPSWRSAVSPRRGCIGGHRPRGRRGRKPRGSLRWWPRLTRVRPRAVGAPSARLISAEVSRTPLRLDEVEALLASGDPDSSMAAGASFAAEDPWCVWPAARAVQLSRPRALRKRGHGGRSRAIAHPAHLRGTRGPTSREDPGPAPRRNESFARRSDPYGLMRPIESRRASRGFRLVPIRCSLRGRAGRRRSTGPRARFSVELLGTANPGSTSALSRALARASAPSSAPCASSRERPACALRVGDAGVRGCWPRPPRSVGFRDNMCYSRFASEWVIC